jgi:hypothetical protein
MNFLITHEHVANTPAWRVYLRVVRPVKLSSCSVCAIKFWDAIRMTLSPRAERSTPIGSLARECQIIFQSEAWTPTTMDSPMASALFGSVLAKIISNDCHMSHFIGTSAWLRDLHSFGFPLSGQSPECHRLQTPREIFQVARHSSRNGLTGCSASWHSSMVASMSGPWLFRAVADMFGTQYHWQIRDSRTTEI